MGTAFGTTLWTVVPQGIQALTGGGHPVALNHSLGFAFLAGLAGGALSAALDLRGGHLEDELRAKLVSHSVLFAEAGAHEELRVTGRTSWSRVDLVVTDRLLVAYAYHSIFGQRVRLGPTVIRLRGPQIGRFRCERAISWHTTPDGVTLTLPARGLGWNRTVSFRCANPAGLGLAMGQPV